MVNIVKDQKDFTEFIEAMRALNSKLELSIKDNRRAPLGKLMAKLGGQFVFYNPKQNQNQLPTHEAIEYFNQMHPYYQELHLELRNMTQHFQQLLLCLKANSHR